VTAPVDVSAKATLAVPPDRLWAFLADTDRLNRTVALPPVQFVPLPDPSKKGHYRAEAKFLGLTMSYEEFPFDWVEGRHYRVLRRFESGPIAEISGGIRVGPAAGGSELEVFARIVPRSWVGSVAAKMVLAGKATKDVMELARAFEAHVRGAPPPGLPPAELLHPELLDARLASVRAPGPREQLRRHLLEASDLEVIRMRPFELADRWGEERTTTLRYLLHAAHAGALDLSWNVLCPSCRVAALEASTLSRMKSRAHCETCRLEFGADFAASVEVRFAVNPAVRRARAEVYCIGGPANTPQVAAQFRLEPGERRVEPFTPAPGPLRARCYQAPGILPLEGTRLRIGLDGLRMEPGPAGALEVENALGVEALVVVERESWKESAATAAAVATLQEFRDLFPAEAVAPGEEVGISSLAVLFTDLKGSTDLYRRLGDPKAFAFVQNHFRYLVETVAAHRGGVVKTMGDAVMATFASGRDALEAALEMQQGWARFREGRGEVDGLELKVGVHQGPAIAINNGGRLDYFGTTVNTAARVQGESKGGDVVITRALHGDPEVRAWLGGRELGREELTVSLKGLEGGHTLTRLRPR
jgi:class 3 adenylate cyclase